VASTSQQPRPAVTLWAASILRIFLPGGGLSIARIQLALGIAYVLIIVIVTMMGSDSRDAPITVSAEWPVIVSAERPVTISSERPVTISSERPITISSERPITISSERPVFVSGERPVSVSGERSVTVFAERPVTVSAEQPVTITAERPITISAERPVIITAERPVSGSGERPVPTERPITIAAERPSFISARQAVSLSAFLAATSILLSSALALMLEAWLTRMPASLRAWLEKTRRAGVLETASPHIVRLSLAGDSGRPDLAVIQLAFGNGLVPVLTLLPASAEYGWRLLTITIVSEIVYLAFLGARVAKVAELSDLVGEINKLQLTKRPVKQTIKALEARTEALCRELGFLFEAPVRSPPNQLESQSNSSP
jgi:hypothetical protein